jgi:hypothetical protein
VDGLTPACLTESGCVIPALSEDGRRAVDLRGLLLRLRSVVDAGTVCSYFGADLETLELLAIIEDELKEGSDGQGCPAAD